MFVLARNTNCRRLGPSPRARGLIDPRLKTAGGTKKDAFESSNDISTHQHTHTGIIGNCTTTPQQFITRLRLNVSDGSDLPELYY